jgi:hypothetical protein
MADLVAFYYILKDHDRSTRKNKNWKITDNRNSGPIIAVSIIITPESHNMESNQRLVPPNTATSTHKKRTPYTYWKPNKLQSRT